MFGKRFRVGSLVCTTTIAWCGMSITSPAGTIIQSRPLMPFRSNCDGREGSAVKNVLVVGNLTSGKSSLVNSIAGNDNQSPVNEDKPLCDAVTSITIGEVKFLIWEINSLRYLKGQSYLRLMEDLVKLTNKIKTASFIVFAWNGYSVVIDDVLSFQLVPFFKLCWPHATTLIVSTGLEFEEGRERDILYGLQSWKARCPPDFNFHFLAGKFWTRGSEDSEIQLVKRSVDQVKQWFLDHMTSDEPLACDRDQLEANADKCISMAYSFPEDVALTSKDLNVPACAIRDFGYSLSKAKLQNAARQSRESQKLLSECITEATSSNMPSFFELIFGRRAKESTGKLELRETDLTGIIPFLIVSLAFVAHCIRKVR
jgi:hypothetical protein